MLHTRFTYLSTIKFGSSRTWACVPNLPREHKTVEMCMAFKKERTIIAVAPKITNCVLYSF